MSNVPDKVWISTVGARDLAYYTQGKLVEVLCANTPPHNIHGQVDATPYISLPTAYPPELVERLKREATTNGNRLLADWLDHIASMEKQE